jgi:hypothetical protein
MKTMNPDILDGSGFEPHKVRFRVKQIDKTPASTFTLESRQLAFAVYVTPVWPQPHTELPLGPFSCIGCIVEDGIKKWGPLGCPVHTPSQSHPIRDALETLARESATRKAMIAALGEALYGVKGHTP